MQLTPSKPITLTQMLTIFYHMVVLVNKHNKQHNTDHIITDDLMKYLKKELTLMSSNNDYMNRHINTSVTLLNDYLNKHYIYWVEDFIDVILCNKHRSKYLTSTDWDQIHLCILVSHCYIKSPFRNAQIIFG